LSLLQPLDEFTAAADGLVHAASPPNLGPGQGGALADLDRALYRVRQAAVALDTSVLDALTALLDRRLIEIDGQRRNLVIAGVLIPLAAVLALVVLWFAANGSAPPEGRSERPGSAAGTGATTQPGSELVSAAPAGLEPLAPEPMGPRRSRSSLVGAGHGAHALRAGEAR
jgi:hypothetical protein